MTALTLPWQVSTVQGKIIPDGNIKVIQRLEGGVITDIHVGEGQHLNLNADSLLRQKGLGVLIQSSQLEKQNALSTSINQSGNELDIAVENLNLTQTKLMIIEAEIVKLKSLVASGSAPENDLTAKENELLLTQQEKELQLAQITLYQSQVTGKENEKTMNGVDYKKNLMGELVTKDKAIMDLEKEIEKISKRLSLQIITAPVDGMIQGIGANTIGGIISSEKPIVTIVPDNTPLVLEAMVLNKDIGFVHVGQQVDIKLDTFPFQKYGVIQGEISHISPDAVEDNKLGFVYKIKVKPLTTTLKVEQKTMAISPGMTAQAEIKTGKRRIIEFFLPGIEEVKDGFELR